jgi:hypothetical protein
MLQGTFSVIFGHPGGKRRARMRQDQRSGRKKYLNTSGKWGDLIRKFRNIKGYCLRPSRAAGPAALPKSRNYEISLHGYTDISL